jgi:hypothetical protein
MELISAMMAGSRADKKSLEKELKQLDKDSQ